MLQLDSEQEVNLQVMKTERQHRGMNDESVVMQ
jgi:hypothetical protein